MQGGLTAPLMYRRSTAHSSFSRVARLLRWRQRQCFQLIGRHRHAAVDASEHTDRPCHCSAGRPTSASYPSSCDRVPLTRGHHAGVHSRSHTFAQSPQFAKAVLTGCLRCSELARNESLRAAGRRYQQSRRGRHCHAERRRRDGVCRETPRWTSDTGLTAAIPPGGRISRPGARRAPRPMAFRSAPPVVASAGCRPRRGRLSAGCLQARAPRPDPPASAHRCAPCGSPNPRA